MSEASVVTETPGAGLRLGKLGLGLCALAAVPMILSGGRELFIQRAAGATVVRTLKDGTPRMTGVILLAVSIGLFALAKSRVWRLAASCLALMMGLFVAFFLLGVRIDDEVLGPASRNSFRMGAWLAVVSLGLLLVGATALWRSAGRFGPMQGHSAKALGVGLLAFLFPPVAPAAFSIACAPSSPPESGRGATRVAMILAALGLLWFAAIVVAMFVAHP